MGTSLSPQRDSLPEFTLKKVTLHVHANWQIKTAFSLFKKALPLTKRPFKTHAKKQKKTGQAQCDVEGLGETDLIFALTRKIPLFHGSTFF